MTRSASTTALLEGELDAFASGLDPALETRETESAFRFSMQQAKHNDTDGSGYMVAVE